MKAVYESPRSYSYNIVGQVLMQTSITVDRTNKVSQTEDIGFVKGEQSSRGGKTVWDEDWSK